MANLTDSIVVRVRKTAQQLCKNDQDFDDCMQEGLLKILGMSYGKSEGYYINGARFKIRDYLKKERLHKNREITNTYSEWVERR